jgi:hypothetical protein
MTDAALAPKFAPFPPKDFAVVRHVPHLWIPRTGETLRGWICDPRPDCVGILVTDHADGAMTDHGPVEIARVVHVFKDERIAHLENAPVSRTVDGKEVTFTHEAAVYCESTVGDPKRNGLFAVALKLEAPISEQDALMRTLAIKKQRDDARAAAAATPAPAPAQAEVVDHAKEPAASADKPAEAPLEAPKVSPLAAGGPA